MRMTPAIPRVGSIQKYVLLIPPQLRLPGDRFPGCPSTLMRRRVPIGPCRRQRRRNRCFAPASPSSMRGRLRCLSGLAHQDDRLRAQHTRPLSVPSVEQHLQKLRVVSGSRCEASAADRARHRNRWLNGVRRKLSVGLPPMHGNETTRLPAGTFRTYPSCPAD